MAHLLRTLSYRPGFYGNTATAPSFRSSALQQAAMFLLTIVFAAMSSLAAAAQTPAPAPSYVPPVIASSVSPVPTTLYPLPLTGTQTNLKAPSYVAVDTCGNIYTIDHGYDGNAPITEIPAGGGPATVITAVGNSYGVTMGQDASHTHLLVANNYGTSVSRIPLANCIPQPSQAANTGGGNGALFYYYDPGYSAGDFAGNTYISTNGTCCVTGNYYLVQEVNNSGNILLSNLPSEISSITVDQLQNVYFIMSSIVYELPYVGGIYAAAPVKYGSYLNPVGLSVDSAGNLYIADSSVATIYEIPNEGKAGPNLADQFVVSGGITVNVPVAVNARGDMYYTAAGASTISELTLGNANFNTVAPGQNATRVVNFQFNAGVTITGITAPGGDFSIQPPSPGTTACAAGTTYGAGISSAGTNKSSCQVTVGFTPQTVGKQSSAVTLAYTIGSKAFSISAFVEGVGQGSLVTIDPGTLAPAAAGVKSPASIIVDNAGNTFIADPGNNAVMEYPVGGGAPISVAVQAGAAGLSTPLSGPLGVAVDGAGNVFIADTGNNRVVEVPFLNGALSPAGSTVIDSALKNPSSVFAHTNGDLYVADTGDNAVLAFPRFAGPSNAGGAFGAPVTLGTGLLAPLAVTVDAAGNVYVADSGNNQILGFPQGGGQEIVAAPILNPSGLATDSSGSLFVVDQGNNRVLRIPSVNGTLNPNAAAEVGLGIVNPYGVAVDGSSNLYVTDKNNGVAYTVARSQLSLTFGDLAVGTTSAALPLTVESAGNLPLIFNTPFFTETGNTGDFAMTSPTGACASGITLSAGASCDLATTFTPTVAGSRSAVIAFATNSANAPRLTLVGTGVSPSPTTTILALTTSVAGAPFYGEPLSFTATVASSGGSGSPTGVVAFLVDGVQIALEPLVKGVATLPLNSGLSGGAHTVSAVYKGDVADNGSSSSQAVMIARAPTTPTIVLNKVHFNNPYSINHSNAGSCNVTDILTHTNQFPAILSDSVGFTAAVTSAGVGVPSGTLTFYSDGKPINGTVAATPALSPATGGSFAANQTVYIRLGLTNVYGETAPGVSASVTTTSTNNAVSVALAKSYGTAATGVTVYEADVASGSPAPTAYHQVGQYALGATVVVTKSATGAAPSATDPSTTPVLPASGGIFGGKIATDADTLGDGMTLGENNTLVTPHVITVVYSGDQNYLPSTSVGTVVTVTDVSPTTPVTLPLNPVSPAPYCDATSTITGSTPSDPASFTVTPSSTAVTASAATPGTVTLTFNSLGGWNGGIDVACSNLPQYTTCSLNPGQTTLGPSTPGATAVPPQTVLTFTTNVTPIPPTASQSAFLWLPALILGFLTISGRRHLRGFKGGRLAALLGVAILSGMAGLSGCTSGIPTNPGVKTPVGTSAVTVTFTGAQHDNYGYNEVFRSDVPYSITIALTVQ